MAEPVVVDVRGLRCPLPVLKTAKRMEQHPLGTIFIILSTDPMAAIDVPHFCSENRHRLLSHSEDEGVLRFELEKGA